MSNLGSLEPRPASPTSQTNSRQLADLYSSNASTFASDIPTSMQKFPQLPTVINQYTNTRPDEIKHIMNKPLPFLHIRILMMINIVKYLLRISQYLLEDPLYHSPE